MTDDQMPEVEAGCSELNPTRIGEAWAGFVHDRAVSVCDVWPVRADFASERVKDVVGDVS